MNSRTFYFSPSCLSLSCLEPFAGTDVEKKVLGKILSEWNTRLSISSLCHGWKKERPAAVSENLLFLVYNIESLNTHETDLVILLNNYNPHVCVLTGVGIASRRMPTIPGYRCTAQTGSNAFGGVAILYRNALKCRVIERDANVLIVEMETASGPLKIGAIYVPPRSALPLLLMSKHTDEPFVYFGDYNAKHTHWNCTKSNTAGNELYNWIEQSGTEVIAPSKATSRRSDSIIDFGITHDGSEWQIEVLEEGTSDHRPILYQSNYCDEQGTQFRSTNWNIFTFFLSVLAEYWKSLANNMEPDEFVELWSLFLSSLWDRCSVYKRANEYRSPWPASLVHLAKEVNKSRRRYRRTKDLYALQRFLSLKGFFIAEKTAFLQTKQEMKKDWIKEKQNIWKYAKPIFNTFSPPFKGLTVDDGRKITDPEEITSMLADHYERHFAPPEFDKSNPAHINFITQFNELANEPNYPLGEITYAEVYGEWRAFKPKKSMDSANTSALLLKKLPPQFIQIVATLFNRCASAGGFFQMAKHAKVICLSKDGLFPTVDKLRPISLLPNIGKWFERIIHKRLIRWCNENNIYTDEQSGFTQGRRLQTRILSLIEDLRLTTAACNRPALVLFVDFLSAFDRMWYPALLSHMKNLGTPQPLLKWIYNWLQNRSLSLHFGDARSRTIRMHVGAPQGSVLAATLFRFHIYTLPSRLRAFETHLFADDLAIQISSDIEKRLSLNIIESESRAEIAFGILERFAEDNILPVNGKKTKAMLIHTAVAPTKPRLKFKGQPIDYVNSFRYLGVIISTKLGWGTFISERIRKIRNIYKGMKVAFRHIPKSSVTIRKKLFSAFAMPHFQWLMAVWFFFTEKQQQYIHHVYCSGLRCVFSLGKWDDETTLILCQTKTLLDHVHLYWTRFIIHLEQSPDAVCFWQTLCAYRVLKDKEKDWSHELGLRKSNKFLSRLQDRARHTFVEWQAFDDNQKQQRTVFSTDTRQINEWIYKFFLQEHYP
jgi:hypothetical protein